MKNKIILGAFGSFAIFAIIFLALSLYRVPQTKQAIRLRLGESKAVETEPGLKFKFPIIDTIVFFDKRLLDFDAPTSEVIASDQKRLLIDAFAKYKIIDALTALKSAEGNEKALESSLNSILDSSIREVVGRYTLLSLLSENRVKVMDEIKINARKQAKEYGVEIVDVRIKRTDLPPENSYAIFERMRTDREREAREFRAQGQGQANEIRAQADREKQEILAQAKKEAQVIMGNADAQSIKILATAYSKDLDFLEFYKTIEAYKDSLPGSKFVLSPDSQFMKYIKNESSK